MISRLFVLFALCAACPLAQALDFKSLDASAIVYDGGSTKATPLFILLKGTPVEVITAVDNWVKIREQSGGLGWIASSAVSDTHAVIVTAPVAQIRSQPSDSAPVVFSVEKNVLLEPVEKGPGAWLKVRHRDGQSGFVSLKSIWGF